jgi:hypothetical protein
MAGASGEPFVRSVKRNDRWGGNVTLEIQTADGIDTITNGRHFSVSSKVGKQTKWKFNDDDNDQ